MVVTYQPIIQQLLYLPFNLYLMLWGVMIRSGVYWHCIRIEWYSMVIASCWWKLFGVLEDICILS